MDTEAINRAARFFAEARRTGAAGPRLPVELRPGSADDAHAIQDATFALLNESIGGWKAGFDPENAPMRAPIPVRWLFTSPARFAPEMRPRLGIECEVAFLLRRALPPRDEAYSRQEVIEAVEPLATIEVLGSRTTDPMQASFRERQADCIINGGLVCGPTKRDWSGIDLAKLEVVLTIDGSEVLRRTATHPNGDPLAPLVAFANGPHPSVGLAAGQIVTTGSWTGVNLVPDGRSIRAEFLGLSVAEIEFTL